MTSSPFYFSTCNKLWLANSWPIIKRARRLCRDKTWSSAFVSPVKQQGAALDEESHSDDLMMMTCKCFSRAQMSEDQRRQMRAKCLNGWTGGRRKKKKKRCRTGLFCLLPGKEAPAANAQTRSGVRLRSSDRRTASNKVWHRRICPRGVETHRRVAYACLHTYISPHPPTLAAGRADIHGAISCLAPSVSNSTLHCFCPGNSGPGSQKDSRA